MGGDASSSSNSSNDNDSNDNSSSSDSDSSNTDAAAADELDSDNAQETSGRVEPPSEGASKEQEAIGRRMRHRCRGRPFPVGKQRSRWRTRATHIYRKVWQLPQQLYMLLLLSLQECVASRFVMHCR